MNRLIKSTLLAGALLALSACGFHLRGLSAPLTPLPFASIAIQQAGSLAEPLQSALQRDGRVQLQSLAADAEDDGNDRAPGDRRDRLAEHDAREKGRKQGDRRHEQHDIGNRRHGYGQHEEGRDERKADGDEEAGPAHGTEKTDRAVDAVTDKHEGEEEKTGE